MRDSRSTPSAAVFASRWLFFFAFPGEISPQEWLENSGVGNLCKVAILETQQKYPVLHCSFMIEGRVWDVCWDVSPTQYVTVTTRTMTCCLVRGSGSNPSFGTVALEGEYPKIEPYVHTGESKLHCFPMVGMVINPVVGVCIPTIRIP